MSGHSGIVHLQPPSLTPLPPPLPTPCSCSPPHPRSIQSLIMFLGMGSGLLVCLAAVQRGDMTVGDTVLFMGLMTQLYQPLAFFGSNYRWVRMGGWF